MTAMNCLYRSFLFALFVSLALGVATAQANKPDATSTTIAPSSVTSTAIPATMFDMTTHSDVLSGTPWPTPTIYGLRLWDTDSGWGQINTASGVYDWTTLDSWIAAAAAHNTQLVYVFGMTPTWASSKPNDTTCDYGNGFCDPPNDLKTDGTGTDQHFINFVTAIAQHAPSITYWEMWNTPHDTLQWTGTDAQLVRMVKDARTYIKKYIPNAKIISPANGQLNYPYPASNCTMPDKMGEYLGAGLGKYLDIMAFHTYYDTVPEHVVPVVQCYQSIMTQYGLSSLPLWSTEGAWGLDTSLPDTADQDGYLARLYLLLWSNGVVRHYWYAWDDDQTGTLSNNGVINSAGIAYEQIESWMSGRTMTTPCAENSSGIWTCGLTGSNGYSAQAVWYPGGTATYTAPSTFTSYLDLSGAQHNVSAGTSVTVGTEPILLQNQSQSTGNPDFAMTEPSSFPEVTVGGTGTSGTVSIESQGGFTGTVTLSCPSTYGANSCSVTPTTVSTYPATATLVVNGTSFSAGSYQIAVQGVSGSITNTLNVSFNVGDFSVTGPPSLSSSPSAQATANLTLASLYSFSGQVTATCDALALAGAQCSLSPTSSISIPSGGSVPVTATIAVPSSAAAGTYNVNIEVQASGGSLTHSLTIPVTLTAAVQDFGFGSFSPPAQTINAGQSAAYNFSITPVGSSFPNAVTLSCAGLPSLTQCSFSPNPVTPGSSAAGVVMTITTTASSSSARHSLGKVALLQTSWFFVSAVLIAAGRRRSRHGKGSLLALLPGLILLALLMTSCAGGTGTAGMTQTTTSTAGGGGGTSQPGTPAGTYYHRNRQVGHADSSSQRDFTDRQLITISISSGRKTPARFYF